jgi:hypothetical protein
MIQTALIFLALAFIADIYFIYLCLNPPRKPAYPQEMAKYFWCMEWFNVDHYTANEAFAKIKTFDELIEVNKTMMAQIKKRKRNERTAPDIKKRKRV